MQTQEHLEFPLEDCVQSYIENAIEQLVYRLTQNLGNRDNDYDHDNNSDGDDDDDALDFDFDDIRDIVDAIDSEGDETLIYDLTLEDQLAAIEHHGDDLDLFGLPGG